MIIALFSGYFSCIKWDNIYSDFFQIPFGAVLGKDRCSPILFAVYMMLASDVL